MSGRPGWPWNVSRTTGLRGRSAGQGTEVACRQQEALSLYAGFGDFGMIQVNFSTLPSLKDTPMRVLPVLSATTAALVLASCGQSSSSVKAAADAISSDCGTGPVSSHLVRTANYELVANAGPLEAIYTKAQVAAQHPDKGEMMITGEMTGATGMAMSGGSGSGQSTHGRKGTGTEGTRADPAGDGQRGQGEGHSGGRAPGAGGRGGAARTPRSREVEKGTARLDSSTPLPRGRRGDGPAQARTAVRAFLVRHQRGAGRQRRRDRGDRSASRADEFPSLPRR